MANDEVKATSEKDSGSGRQAKDPVDLLFALITILVALVPALAPDTINKYGVFAIPIYCVFGFLVVVSLIVVFRRMFPRQSQVLVGLFGAVHLRWFLWPFLLLRQKYVGWFVLAVSILLLCFVFQGQIIDFATGGTSRLSSVWIASASSDETAQLDLQKALDDALLHDHLELATSSTKAGMVINLFDLTLDQSPGEDCGDEISPQRLDVNVSASVGHRVSPLTPLHQCGQANPNMFPDDAEQLSYHSAMTGLAQKIVAFATSWRAQ